MAALQINQVLGLQSPLDFRIVRQRAGTGTGYVGQNAIETRTRLVVEHVRVDDLHIARRDQFSQQPRAVRMQLQGNNAGLGICSASTRVFPPGAAQQSRIFEPFPTSNATSCEASSWIVTRPSLKALAAETFPARTLRADATQLAGGQLDAIAPQFSFRASVCQTDRSRRSMLVVAANLSCPIQTELQNPALDQP